MYHPSLVLSIAIVISSSLGPGLVDSGVIVDYQPPLPQSDEHRPAQPGRMHSRTPEASPAGQDTPVPDGSHPCPECEHERQLARLRATHTEEEIHQIRLNYIKQQILRKLQLESPPNVTKKPTTNKLLERIFEHENAVDDPSVYDTDIEEFYGKKTLVVVFGERIEGCEDDGRPEACFRFELENKLSVDELVSADLFVYKSREHVRRQGRRPSFRRTIEVSDLYARTFGSSHILARKSVLEKRGLWVSFNMKHTVKRWLQRPARNHGIQVACDNCTNYRHQFPIQAGGDKKPFLVIHTRDRRNRRKKRDVSCPNQASCCMESFSVNFADLGWADWIIAPTHYRSNYCRGSCRLLPSLNKNKPNRALVHILQKASEVENDPNLLPCCAPTRMSHLSMIYYDDQGEIIRQDLPNMVVESCGCS